MLSVCIPIFNFDVNLLVTHLHEQCVNAGIEFEILCIDDASDKKYVEFNSNISNLKNVNYTLLEENVGRSKIRNLLAQNARYNSLLFLDCDSELVDNDFIKRYVDSIKEGAVIYGGRCYRNQPSEEANEYFRWWYGINREVISVQERKKSPYHSFMTNNFLIPKNTYLSIKLDENLKGYGHEDTLFGIELENQNVSICHINNPLCHIGLEEFDEFLRKTKEGIKNLVFLSNKKMLSEEVRLLKFYKKIKAFGLDKSVLKYYQKNEQKIITKLQEKECNLKWFDVYKLGYLISLMRS